MFMVSLHSFIGLDPPLSPTRAYTLAGGRSVGGPIESEAQAGRPGRTRGYGSLGRLCAG